MLIVDEHEVARRGVRVLVDALPGFTVCAEAGTAQDARKAVAAAAPDIVVLDVRLASGGVDLIRELGASPAQPQVIVLTSTDSEQLLSEAIDAGARAYVLKSAPSQQITDALLALASHKPYPHRKAFGLGGGEQAAPSRSLTRREREIVGLVASGASNKRIAEMLAISVKTVETHRSSAMHKIGARTAADVVRYAVRNRLIDPLSF